MMAYQVFQLGLSWHKYLHVFIKRGMGKVKIDLISASSFSLHPIQFDLEQNRSTLLNCGLSRNLTKSVKKDCKNLVFSDSDSFFFSCNEI